VNQALCGLDVGISTTDAVAGWNERVSVSLPTRGAEETARAAVESLLDLAGPPPGGLVIAATGAGSHRLGDRLSGHPVCHVPEVSAIGRGGAGLSHRSEVLVVSLGTGTAMVSVRGREMTHVSPGTGVGGGTLLGLARALLGVSEVSDLAALARRGDRTRLDITIGEAIGGPLGALPERATASNFAKFDGRADRADLAASLANLVAEVVLTVTILGLQAARQGTAIMTGKLLLFEPVRQRVGEASAELGGLFVIPENAAVATALGALWTLADGEGR
jgi:type II pantothenate kinase